jgi:hypothetical protein
MVEYKGYFIFGKALRVHPTSSDRWRSQGSVYTNTQAGSVLIKSLDGVTFESQRAAQDHGLELCKKWIDENPNKKA